MKNAIVSAVKLLFPLATPIVDIDLVYNGNYHCRVYLNESSKRNVPLFKSYLRNSEDEALKNVLVFIKEALRTKALDEGKNRDIKILHYKEEIKNLELDIERANRDFQPYDNLLKKMESLLQ